MLKNNYITKQEHNCLGENLENPQTPLFYRLIIFSFCTWSLSRSLDHFLKFQTKKCKSYIRDTKDFIIKLSSIKNIPGNSFLVSMDVSSLYTNISHEEGTKAYFKKVEERKNKSIPSIIIIIIIIIKSLILIILKLNTFWFGNKYYRQITVTAMGTSLAPNYANFFMDNFEQNLLVSIFEKLDCHLWYSFVLLTIFSSHGLVTRTRCIN